MNRCLVKASNGGPLRYGSPDRPYFNYSIGAFVVGLFAQRCPSAIIWRVVAIIVNAVNGVSFARRLAHISCKVFKAFPPTTYPYPASTVPMERYRRWILAPGYNSVPNVAEAVAGKPLRAAPLAATGCRVGAHQIIPSYGGDAPAGAGAQAVIASVLNNREMAEILACKRDPHRPEHTLILVNFKVFHVD